MTFGGSSSLRSLYGIPKSIAIIIFSLALISAPTAFAQKEGVATRKNRLADVALEKVPPKARARKNPFEGDSKAVAAGGKLYETHCAICHGEKAGGTKPGTSLLREGMRESSPGAIFWILTNGIVRQGMPVWSKLPEPQRWQIVTFLESLKPRGMTPYGLNSAPENEQCPTQIY